MGLFDGLMSPLYTGVSWVVIQFHALLSPIFGTGSGWSWGLAIVGLVVLIRICLIPLFVKQIKSTRNMQELSPRIQEIQKKYKNDKERASQEIMKLYKETGTNPLSSCLPILLQAPFFFALFRVLDGIANGEAYGVLTHSLVQSAQRAEIFGAPIALKFTDSAEKVAQFGADLTMVRIVTVVMIVLMSASQFITQRQLMIKNTSPAAANNPFVQQQKILLYVLPLVFAVFGINFPVGVLLYWLTSNSWSMGQQLFVIRRMPTPGSEAHRQLEERLRKRGKLKTGDAAAGNTAAGNTATGNTATGKTAGAGSTVAGSPDVSTAQDSRTRRQQPNRVPRSKRTAPAQKGSQPRKGRSG
ncbi:MAG: membrane protein insertase YidC [Streptomycetales bacterium]